MSSPFFSIIMPIYNAKKYLCEAVDSVLAQTCRDFELICVNDGSSDGSETILDEYAEKFKVQGLRFKVIHQLNQGVSVARNRGLEEATGDWIMWLDADDMYASWRLECIKEIIDSEHPDIIRTRFAMSDSFDKTCFKHSGYEVYSDDCAKEWVWNKLVACGMMWTFAARKELFDNNVFAVGMRIKEEWTVCARMANRVHKVIQSESVDYFYRLNVDSAMHSKRKTDDCLKFLDCLVEVARSGLCNIDCSLQRVRFDAECDIIDWVLANPANEGLERIREKYLELKEAGVFNAKSIQQYRYRIPMWWFDKTGQVWMIRTVDKVIGVSRALKTGLTRFTGWC